ncbi:hypothetical protein Tco_0442596 [Tanacetum coccineum]
MVPLMLQQAVGMLADPKEKKLREMESERSGLHGSTSMETPNNSNNGSSVEKIGIEADKDQVIVRNASRHVSWTGGKLIQLMHTIMVPEQVKTMKIQAGVQVSRPEDVEVIFSIGSTLEDFILGKKERDREREIKREIDGEREREGEREIEEEGEGEGWER